MRKQYDLRNLDKASKIQRIIQILKDDNKNIKFINMNDVTFCVTSKRLFKKIPVLKRIKTHYLFQVYDAPITDVKTFFTYKGLVKSMLRTVKKGTKS